MHFILSQTCFFYKSNSNRVVNMPKASWLRCTSGFPPRGELGFNFNPPVPQMGEFDFPLIKNRVVEMHITITTNYLAFPTCIISGYKYVL